MNSLPKFTPLQWIMIEGDNAFAQITNVSEKPEIGWVYRISINGNDDNYVNETSIVAFMLDGKWVNLSSVTSQNVYS